jgi:hypothetical protein
MYINTCATFANTPYLHLLTNLKKEERALMGHSNMGLGGMDMSGEMGAVNQMWLNKGGVATIIPLKVIEKIWPVTYDSRRNGGHFIIHTNQGNIIIKNNSKGMSTSGMWRQRWHCRSSRQQLEPSKQPW